MLGVSECWNSVTSPPQPSFFYFSTFPGAANIIEETSGSETDFINSVLINSLAVDVVWGLISMFTPTF